MVYLDNAATTRVSDEVLEEMMPFLRESYGNPGSPHMMGKIAADAVALARRRVADLFGCSPENIIFTSGGSEANNLAIIGSTRRRKGSRNKHIITSAIEHESVLKAVESLIEGNYEPTKDSFYASIIKPNKHNVVTRESVEEALRPDTGLVSVMTVNNETGIINDTKEIGEMCAELGIDFHTDCVQAAGSIELDKENQYHADFISISGHKIHAPKGVGALYVRDKESLSPIINGGDAQEFGLRGGTENVASIVGFGKACEVVNFEQETISRNYCNLKRDMISFLTSNGINFSINDGIHNCNKVLSVTLRDIDADTLIIALNARGFCISAGSACQNLEVVPSHVLKAMGISDDMARRTVRISFSKYSTREECEALAVAIREVIDIMKGVAGHF